MKISLFQGILIGAFGLGALIGLFVFATYTSSGGAQAVGSVIIWGTLPKADMQTTLTALAQTNEALKNVSYVQKSSATLPTELAAAIATGAPPDLVLASQEELHTLAKFITPIAPATLSASTFTNAFIEGGEIFTAPFGAGYYGIPFLVDSLVLFSNRSTLSSLGIAKAPATWESLTGLVPTIAVLTPTRQITRGLIALGAYNNVHNARAILSTLLLQTGIPISVYSAGGELAADLGSGTANGVPPGQSVLGFYTQFADPSKVSYTWNPSLPDSQQAFLAGDLALYLGYASEARFLTSANPNLNFVVTPIPQPATATVKSAYGLIYAFMIPRGAKNAAGAYQVAVLFTNSAEQAAFASATGLAPATLNALVAMPASPAAAVAYDEALYTRGWLSPMPADTDQIFSGMIENVISGRSVPATALVNAEQSLDAILQP